MATASRRCGRNCRGNKKVVGDLAIPDRFYRGRTFWGTKELEVLKKAVADDKSGKVKITVEKEGAPDADLIGNLNTHDMPSNSSAGRS